MPSDVFVDALVVVDVAHRGPALRTEAPGAAHGGPESAHRGSATLPTEAPNATHIGPESSILCSKCTFLRVRVRVRELPSASLHIVF